MELETPGYTRPLGGLGSSVCIPRHRSVSPTNRQLESSSSSSALRDGPPLRLQPRPLGVIKDDNFINCMSAGAAWGAPPLVAPRSAAPARPGAVFDIRRTFVRFSFRGASPQTCQTSEWELSISHLLLTDLYGISIAPLLHTALRCPTKTNPSSILMRPF